MSIIMQSLLQSHWFYLGLWTEQEDVCFSRDPTAAMFLLVIVLEKSRRR